MYIVLSKDFYKIKYLVNKKILKKNIIKRFNGNLKLSIKELNSNFNKNNIYFLKKKVNRKLIISIIGHVNDGKTTLIRNVLNNKIKEFGNITQNINVYEVNKLNYNYLILDTPGHYVFDYIKKHAINFSDFIIFILSSEKISKKTIKILKYIKESKKNFAVALNKSDLFTINSSKIKNKYFKNDKILFYKISALTGNGIDYMLNQIYIKNIELLKFIKKNYAVIINNYYEKKIGNKCEIILKSGNINIGDFILDKKKNKIGKVINIICCDKKVNYCFSVSHCFIYGIKTNIKIGSQIFFNKKFENNKKIVLKKIFVNNNISFLNKKTKKKNLIIISDNENSIKSLCDMIKKNYYKYFQIKKKKVGTIEKDDIDFAKYTKSKIIYFNSICENNYETNKEIFVFKLIYDLENFLKKLINFKKKINKFVVTNIFSVKKTKIIGGRVVSGKIKINDIFTLYRKNKIINKNLRIKTIKIYEKESLIVNKNEICSIYFENFNDFQINDIIYSTNE
ncbi:GTP-binding protein [Candidatus Vidania fulgoroideorum]